MQPDDIEGYPVSSFQFPIEVPADDPDAGTFFYVGFNEDYLPAIIGSLYQLLQQFTWNTDDPAILELAQQRSSELIYMFQEGVSMFPTGSVVSYGGSSAPSGWLLCDGIAVSRTTYADLFALLDATFGPGDGSTTFNLPDLRGRVPVGVGQQSGGTNFTLALTGGEEQHTLVTAETPSHTHTDTGHVHSTGNSILLGTVTPPPLDALGPNPLPAFTGSASANLTNSGGDGAHNNLQPYQALTAIIKT